MRRERIRDELEQSWTLGPDEHTLLSGKRGATRLGFAIVLRFFARKGRFPDPAEINEEVVEHVAAQVAVPAAQYQSYDHRSRTAEYHRAQIREAFGFRQATVEDSGELREWLLDEVAPHEYDTERLGARVAGVQDHAPTGRKPPTVVAGPSASRKLQ